MTLQLLRFLGGCFRLFRLLRMGSRHQPHERHEVSLKLTNLLFRCSQRVWRDTTDFHFISSAIVFLIVFTIFRIFQNFPTIFLKLEYFQNFFGNLQLSHLAQQISFIHAILTVAPLSSMKIIRDRSSSGTRNLIVVGVLYPASTSTHWFVEVRILQIRAITAEFLLHLLSPSQWRTGAWFATGSSKRFAQYQQLRFEIWEAGRSLIEWANCEIRADKTTIKVIFRSVSAKIRELTQSTRLYLPQLKFFI